MKNLLLTAGQSLVGLLFCLSPSFAAPPAYNIQLGVANESFDPGDSDTYTQLTGSMRYSKGLSRHSVTNWNIDIFSRSYQDLDQKDKNGLLLEFIYSYVASGGFSAPTYSIGLRHEIETFDDSANDSGKTSLLLAISRRLDDSLTLTGGVELAHKTSDLIESDFTGVFANLDKQLTDRAILYLNLKLQDEDSKTDAAMAATRPALRPEIASSHLPGEPGYTGSSFSDSASDNGFLTIGINYFMDSHQAIDLSYETIDYDGESSTTADIISLDYFYKF